MLTPTLVLQLRLTIPQLLDYMDTFSYFLSLKLSLKELVVNTPPYKWKKLPHLKHLGKFGPSATMKRQKMRWEPSCEKSYFEVSCFIYIKWCIKLYRKIHAVDKCKKYCYLIRRSYYTCIILTIQILPNWYECHLSLLHVPLFFALNCIYNNNK